MNRTLFSIAVLWVMSAHAQPYSLSLQLAKGQSYYHSLSSEAKIFQDIGGDQIETNMTINSHIKWEVKSLKKDAYEMQVSYTSIEIEMLLPEGKMNFSSVPPQSDIFSALLNQIVNEPFDVILFVNGELSGISGMEEIFDTAFESIAENVSEEKLAQVKGQFLKAIGPDALAGNIQTALTIFPDQAVNVGSSWERTTSFIDGMDARISSEYELVEVTNKSFIVKGRSSVKTKDKMAFYELNGKNFRYDIRGTRTSTIEIDRKTGWVIKASVSQSIGGDSFLQAADELSEELAIPITIDNEITVTGK